MCQMCDEYENELVRMGLLEDARKWRAERQREHEAALATRGGTKAETGKAGSVEADDRPKLPVS